MKRTDTASLVIAAAPSALYRAFSDAKTLMEWLPPTGMTGRALEYDFREGGRYRLELSYEDEPAQGGKTTSRSDISVGRFTTLERDRRIVQTVEFESTDAAFAGEMIMTWTFEPVAGGTLVTITATNVPSGISKEDHDAGLRASLQNLAAACSTK